MQIFELGHTTVPYGVKAQGHAAGTNQREKNPQIATKEERTTCTGTENKTSQLVSRRGGNSENRNFEQAEKKIPRRGRRHQCSSRDGSVEQTPFRGRKTPG